MKTRAKLKFQNFPTDYPALVNMLPPRPIHDRVDYDNVMEVVLAMAGHRMTTDQEDYFELLSELIIKYDQEHGEKLPDGTPRERLRTLMKTAEMSASDLGRLLGNRGLGSSLLNGAREMSKTHIRKLCQHFHLSADYFL
ncbi:MAG: transcriptional regulator [Phycisphaerales bacterium]|nr:transcriptional regulator [Phycisphaerales bacterium]